MTSKTFHSRFFAACSSLSCDELLFDQCTIFKTLRGASNSVADPDCLQGRFYCVLAIELAPS